MLQIARCTAGKHDLTVLYDAPCKDCEIERLRKLYYLAAHDVISFSTYDAKTDTWPDCGQFYTPVVNLNDTFAYACADGEELKDDQIDSLIRMYKEYDYPGIIAWAASIRGSEPIEPWRDEKYRIARAALSATDGAK